MRAVRQHARQISIERAATCIAETPQVPEASTRWRRPVFPKVANRAANWARSDKTQQHPMSKASAVWTGSLKEGKGTISTATGVLSNANYSFATRFEGAASGTTPEELIAAAHASCFSMALGAQLGGAGLTPDKIETHAAVTLAKTDGGFAITKIALTTTASVPGATKEAFDKAAADAKAGCPISKLFANNTEIELDAKLV
jgi:osmotically inducible protein OsmC